VIERGCAENERRWLHERSTSTCCFDGTRLDTEDLTVPHPRMWERGFVLAPLRDVAPDLVDTNARWKGVRDAGVTLESPPGV
jgi:hypothetical protein